MISISILGRRHEDLHFQAFTPWKYSSWNDTVFHWRKFSKSVMDGEIYKVDYNMYNTGSVRP